MYMDLSSMNAFTYRAIYMNIFENSFINSNMLTPNMIDGKIISIIPTYINAIDNNRIILSDFIEFPPHFYFIRTKNKSVEKAL